MLSLLNLKKSGWMIQMQALKYVLKSYKLLKSQMLLNVLFAKQVMRMSLNIIYAVFVKCQKLQQKH